MSGEKIYPASQRKRKQAREEGQVAKSAEIISLVTLCSCLLTIYFFKKNIFKLMEKFLVVLRTNVNSDINPAIVTEFIKEVLLFLTPLFCVTFVAAFLANYFQVGLFASLKVLKPDIKKINPISGFKKMFSKDSLVELGKSLVKVTGVLYITFDEISQIIYRMNSAYTEDLMTAFNYIFDNLFNIVTKISLLLLALSILDFIYKKIKFENDLKMTRQEMMDEHKQSEGNPHVKGKQREFGRMLTKRQIQKVKEATVVITNPTHYAIAIQYDAISSPIPKVLFKGVDEVAQLAKKIAAENNIPMVENRPLARALYATVKEDSYIPNDMFDAVAEVIAYVYTINDTVK